MDVVVQHLRAKFPRAPIAAVGVSAGGHVLLRYLQATGVNCPLVAAVAISPCQDLIKETQRVRAEENPGYMYFLRYCVMTCAARHMAEGDWSDEENAAYVAVPVGIACAGGRFWDWCGHISTVVSMCSWFLRQRKWEFGLWAEFIPLLTF